MKLLDRTTTAILLFFLPIVLIFMFACPQSLQADELKYRLGIFYNRINTEVKTMPLKVRDVPIHSNDTYALKKNAGPIEKEKYSASSMWTIGLGFMKKTKNLKYGLRLHWLIYPHRFLYDNELRNYTNAVGTERRGYGAALTFVGLEMRGIIPSFSDEISILDILFNIAPEIVIEAPINKKLSLGTSLGYYQLQAVNGWDRYNNLEVNDRYTLAHYFPLSFYCKYRILTLGVKLPFAHYTNLGERANVETPDITFFTALEAIW